MKVFEEKTNLTDLMKLDLLSEVSQYFSRPKTLGSDWTYMRMYVNYILGNCAQLITWMRCTLTDLMEWGLYLNTSLEWVSLCTREFSTGWISFKGIINLNAMHTDDRLDGVRLIYEHISGCSYMHQRTPTQPTYYVFKNMLMRNWTPSWSTGRMDWPSVRPSPTSSPPFQ